MLPIKAKQWIPWEADKVSLLNKKPRDGILKLLGSYGVIRASLSALPCSTIKSAKTKTA
jgi:hypothetical protein